MKIKIERTVNVDEAPEEAKRSMVLAIDQAVNVHNLVKNLSKKADEEPLNAYAVNQEIHAIRECLFEMDLMLSDASNILITYQAATAQEAASIKQISENEE